MQRGVLGTMYQAGEIIMRQGDVGDYMVIIQEGRVEIVVEQGSQEVQLAVREAGQPIGEMGVFERQPRCATVRALGRARVLTVDKMTFLRGIHQDPSLAFSMMQTMSERIREMSALVANH